MLNKRRRSTPLRSCARANGMLNKRPLDAAEIVQANGMLNKASPLDAAEILCSRSRSRSQGLDGLHSVRFTCVWQRMRLGMASREWRGVAQCQEATEPAL